MEVSKAINDRRSVKKFDPKHRITDAELNELFKQVILSPSSFNLQHWRFVVVRDPDTKALLRKAAFDQEQVETASAAIVVLGKLHSHEDAERIYASAPEGVRKAMVPMIHGFYANNPAAQHDEAIRSAALAAMTLMLAAKDMGYATGPMIGFNPQEVCRILRVDDRHIPVMIVVLGKQIGDLRRRDDRLPPSEVVKLESFDGRGLG